MRERESRNWLVAQRVLLTPDFFFNTIRDFTVYREYIVYLEDEPRRTTSDSRRTTRLMYACISSGVVVGIVPHSCPILSARVTYTAKQNFHARLLPSLSRQFFYMLFVSLTFKAPIPVFRPPNFDSSLRLDTSLYLQ